MLSLARKTKKTSLCQDLPQSPNKTCKDGVSRLLNPHVTKARCTTKTSGTRPTSILPVAGANGADNLKWLPAHQLAAGHARICSFLNTTWAALNICFFLDIHASRRPSSLLSSIRCQRRPSCPTSPYRPGISTTRTPPPPYRPVLTSSASSDIVFVHNT